MGDIVKYRDVIRPFGVCYFATHGSLLLMKSLLLMFSSAFDAFKSMIFDWKRNATKKIYKVEGLLVPQNIRENKIHHMKFLFVIYLSLI